MKDVAALGQHNEGHRYARGSTVEGIGTPRQHNEDDATARAEGCQTSTIAGVEMAGQHSAGCRDARAAHRRASESPGSTHIRASKSWGSTLKGVEKLGKHNGRLRNVQTARA